MHNPNTYPFQPHIRQIAAEETIFVRSLALKWGLSPAKCLLPDDLGENVFHLGYFIALDSSKNEGEKLAGVASFFDENMPYYRENEGIKGARLRQMGVLPAFRQQGIGEALIEAGIARLRTENTAYLWCHARRLALGFYAKMGFISLSGEFELPNIGPHRTLLLPL